MLETVSAIVPALNAAETIRHCVEQLEGLGEVIVVDGGSLDQTQEIARQAGAKVIISDRGRGVQLRAGATAAKGNWLLFLHADTLLSDGWQLAVECHIESERCQAAYFGLRLQSSDWRARLIERSVRLRCRFFSLPYGDQGLLISRSLYEEVGGYAAISLMEDVDIVRRIGRDRLVELPVSALTSALRWKRDGWARRSLRNLMVQLLYFSGASPERLARFYR
ncbi:MAG: TIGR04283 family arsenosugar biosynthesis glycosyltransferase [Sphingomicrobium sp.]